MRPERSHRGDRPSRPDDGSDKHKSGYTYLGPDRATQRQRLLEGSAKTPPMETGVQPIGRAAKPREERPRRYEFAGWEFKPDKQGIRRKRAILRERPG
jgi:hypothetical protein